LLTRYAHVSLGAYLNTARRRHKTTKLRGTTSVSAPDEPYGLFLEEYLH